MATPTNKTTLSPIFAYTSPDVLAVAFSFLDYQGLIVIEHLSKNIQNNCKALAERLWGNPSTQLFSPEILGKIKSLKTPNISMKDLLKSNLFRGTLRCSATHLFFQLPTPRFPRENFVSISYHPTATFRQVKRLIAEECGHAQIKLMAGSKRSSMPSSSEVNDDDLNFAELAQNPSLSLTLSPVIPSAATRPKRQHLHCRVS